MGERNPEKKKRESPRFSFEAEGLRHELRPDNAEIYIHEDEPHFDHLFFDTHGHKRRLFREAMANFDSIHAFMENNGYRVIEEYTALPADREAYYRTYGYPEVKVQELTPRQEKKIAFAKYLLDMELVTTEDFGGKDKLV